MIESNQVLVRITSNYGKKAVYPANIMAEFLAELTGTKTFSDYQLTIIRNMGFDIQIEAQKLVA